MVARIEEKNDQHFWNFLFSILFALLLVLSIRYVMSAGLLPQGGIPLFDVLLMSLAIFRVTRLVVYDRITAFLRDIFLRSRTVRDAEGREVVERVSYINGPLRTIHDLLDCPWCVGVWVALATLFSYLVFSFAWYVIFLLAIAGAGSFLQVFSNMIGWKAELLKREAKERGTAQKDR
ncbi:MAG TPA: DUF1360 domain-containing protein [Candidatus Paceibacterota bacterium]